MSAGLGLVTEGVFALDLFRRNGAFFDGWRKQVRQRLGSRVADLEPLLRERRALSELLETFRRGAADSGADARVAGLVFEFCSAAVVPYWDRVQSRLEAERAVRGRIGITTGVEGLLGTLHPNVEWQPPLLEIRDDEERHVELRGRGLLLSPSLFLRGRSCVVIDGGDERPPALVYSMRADVSDVIGVEAPPEQALGAWSGTRERRRSRRSPRAAPPASSPSGWASRWPAPASTRRSSAGPGWRTPHGAGTPCSTH
ncbi:hypothetical protein [Microbispora sp. GKU 823]|uniref:hypothetical protein n=1 Tax=Microbispora sp. GKU 823 TaxID=1652100 RepID=UPI0009A3545A|nr:hypothetical protein [Microbispora sp. GKU 823]